MDLHQDAFNIIIGLTILVGALQCFFGYRIFKLILGLTGFLIGGVLAAAIGSSFSQEVIFILLSGLMGGFIGAALMVTLYFAGIFLIGAILGSVLGTVLYAVAESQPDPAVLLITAVLVGIIALSFQKFMIIVSTAFGGAWGIIIGIAYFITGVINLSNPEQTFSSDGKYLYAILLCWLALGIAGVINQYRFAAKKETQPLPPPAREKESGPYHID